MSEALERELGTPSGSVREREVWTALGSVRDPELDEPITELKFVTEVRVAGGAVHVRLRLPTYFCAPNFAYLMVADAYDAVSALDWTEDVTVRLEDHFASEEINGGVAGDAGFRGSFPGEADAELDELRATFQRKAHAACLERSCRTLLDQAGRSKDSPRPGCRTCRRARPPKRCYGGGPRSAGHPTVRPARGGRFR